MRKSHNGIRNKCVKILYKNTVQFLARTIIIFRKSLKIINIICGVFKDFISAEQKARPLQKGFILCRNTQPIWIVLALAVNFGVGFCVLYYTNTFQKYWIHIICITICMSLTIVIGRKYIDTIYLLDSEIEEENTSENEELRTNYKRFKNYAFHRANLTFCIVVPCIFFWAIFKQNYLSFDAVGIYGIFTISATLFMSILGYVEYMWMLWLLYRISRCEHFCYNQSNPSQTPVLIYIADITNCAKWFFLVEGFLYIFEYFILIPHENLSFDKLQIQDNLSFFITWIILLVVLVLAFPIIVLFQETMITKIIDDLKQKQIQTLSLCFNIASNDLSNHQIMEHAYMCNSIMNNIISSNDYPIKTQRLGPALISVATLVMHIVNLISQLPQISSFINQFQQWYL